MVERTDSAPASWPTTTSKRRAKVGDRGLRGSGLARPVGTLDGCHETADSAGALREVNDAHGVLIDTSLRVQPVKASSGVGRRLLMPDDQGAVVDGGLRV